MKKSSLIISVLVLVCAITSAYAADTRSTVTVFYNGKIFTGGDQQTWVDALAVRGNRVVAVGKSDSLLSKLPDNTQQIDLKGHLLIPGLNDAHAHFLPDFGAVQLPPINIPGLGPTWTQALEQVATASTLAQPGQWVFLIVGESTFLDTFAERSALDAVAPNNPVLLVTWSAHGAIINTAAIHDLGISEQEPDSFGGSYERYPGSDVITGKVHEYAVFRALRTLVSRLPTAAIRGHYLGMSQYLASLGYTSVQEIPLALTRAKLVEALAGTAPAIRLRSICLPLTAAEKCPQPTLNLGGQGLHDEYAESMVSFGGVKWFADGTPIERSAALREPYLDTGALGLLNLLVFMSIHSYDLASCRSLRAHAPSSILCRIV